MVQFGCHRVAGPSTDMAINEGEMATHLNGHINDTVHDPPHNQSPTRTPDSAPAAPHGRTRNFCLPQRRRNTSHPARLGALLLRCTGVAEVARETIS